MILVRFHRRIVIVESNLVICTSIGIDQAHVEELTVLKELVVQPFVRLTHSILWEIILNGLKKSLGELSGITLQTITLIGAQLHRWHLCCTGSRLDCGTKAPVNR